MLLKPLTTRIEPDQFWLLLPLLVILLLWWPALDNSFQFDDWNVIVDEPRVHSLTAWWQAQPAIRPLLKLSYALNYSVSKQVAAFRLINMIIHGINAMLIAWLFCRRALTLGMPVLSARWAGLLTALIFALHPAQTEAVTYISGRSMSLSSLGMLLALCVWERDGRHAIGWSCIWMVMAVACKETALITPALLGLWLLTDPRKPVTRPGTLLAPVFTSLLVAIMLLLLLMLWPSMRRVVLYAFHHQPVWVTWATQPHSLWYLLGQLLRIDQMNADPQVPWAAAVTWMTWIGWTIELGLVWLAFTWRRTYPVAALAVLWFWLCLLPMHSIVPRLDPVNDRQVYLALVGPAFWLVWHALRLAEKPSRVAAAVMAILLVSLATATLVRNRDYQTEISFWEKTATQNPANARAANNLGQAYLLAGQPAAAEREFRRALELEPGQYQARLNLYYMRH